MNKLMIAVLSLVSLAIHPLYGAQTNKSSRVTRFDFMVAIKEGDVTAVKRCLSEGLDVNEQWGQTKDTPLMFAVRQLALERDNQEHISWNVAAATGGLGTFLALAGTGFLQRLPIMNGVKGFNARLQNTNPSEMIHRDGLTITALVASSVVTVWALAYLGFTTVNHIKKVYRYLNYRLKINAARYSIIQLLLEHPRLDLAIKNAATSKDGQGQTALELVRDLRNKDSHGGYVNELLKNVEAMIGDRIKFLQQAAAEQQKPSEQPTSTNNASTTPSLEDLNYLERPAPVQP